MQRQDDYRGMQAIDTTMSKQEVIDQLQKMEKEYYGGDSEFYSQSEFSLKNMNPEELCDLYNGYSIMNGEKTIQPDGLGNFEIE